MFGKIAAFEFRHQTRQPVFWVAAGIFFLLTIGSVVVDQIQIGSGGNTRKNAAFAIAQIHLIWSIFYMFVTAAFVANVVLRDDETGFGPIIRSTRVGRFDYLFGRFVGAMAAVLLSFMAVPLAIMVGTLAPWVDPETLGPFVFSHYLFAYFVLAVPNLLLTGAMFFALATVTRSMMGTYMGVVVFLVLWIVAGIVLNQPQYDRVAALWEPLGTAAYGLVTKYWTATERNSAIPAVAGALLFNRVFALALAAAMLAAAYFLFRFNPVTRSAKVRKARRLRKAEADAPPPQIVETVRPAPRFGAASAWTQMKARTRLEMGQIFRHPAFLVLMAMGVVNALGQLWFATETRYGSDIWPVTRLMIRALEDSFTVIPMVVAIFYAGELVWRERDRRTHEIIDATPLPDWAFVAPKTLGVSLVLLASLMIGVVVAMGIQASKGFTDFAIGEYLLWYVLPRTVDMILIAVLAVFLQAVSPHKFVGWGLMVLFLVVQATMATVGLEHNLYNYGSGPNVPLSDMNGQGRFWEGAWWFRLYWSAFAVVLLVLAHVLWRRGAETRMSPRLRRMGARLNGPAGVVLGLGLCVFAAAGAFIYLNTNVWNEYRTRIDDERWMADYEKTLTPLENIPQPKIASVRLEVDIHPDAPRIDTRGVYVVENRTAQPLRQIHVRFARDLKVKGLSIEGARPQRTLDQFNYRIFAFDTPMMPGERRTLSFITELSQKGFRNRDNLTRVVGNGTFVNDQEIAPGLGVDRNMVLRDRAKRRKYGLAPELRMARLGDQASRQFTYLRRDADWVHADITVTTDADQTPIAPGYKTSDRTLAGRRTARFITEAPILPFFSIQSARYSEMSQIHDGVTLTVFHHPEHDWNTERMLKSLRVGLDYFQTNFGPYQFRQARILEFPAYGDFAQAFAGTIPWSESIGFISDSRDPDKIDFVTYVGAHELGHQWWAHQLIGADQQGATALSESLAQYSALMVMEKLYGREQIRKFLKFELDRYLRARGGEVIEELPLVRVENQPYIHYQKGALVMYRLRDELGEEAVNRALRILLQRYAFQGAPFAIASDLVAALRSVAPADKQDLITDLFERITLYDVKAPRMTSRRRPDGKFDVTLTVVGRKLYADGKGVEREAPLNEVLDVGVFAAEPGKAGFRSGDVLAFERRPVRSGTQTFTFVTERQPRFAGVDPYNKLIDRNSDDNLTRPQ
ncbi:ABC transporter permease/M1 family aminopeptidase [Caulobacter sp. NIBR2454]|uniref:ABC transporter permease/M1 family aminopeptidase n=1 Tax=Caulobacter sp. NIBR2454 TaxID=3015996 RepID=UPI0022B67FD5|nr:M1 family aminopeptidase [Caulobacter sp. NIBR2454]